MTHSGVGVSFVMCCHNSAERLEATLGHVARQEGTASVPWELVLVDNASTDRTSEAARELWPEELRHRLRVLTEPRVGLSNARLRGVREARHAVVSFIDDDNWICPDWTNRVERIMRTNPNVGICGGPSVAVLESEAPAWFPKYERWFAIGPQTPLGDDPTQGLFWGAGLAVRREAILELLEGGFEFQLAGRRGAALSSGEDYELVMALRMSGWQGHYDQDLALRHFMPTRRLTWQHLRGIHRGYGASLPFLEAYRSEYRAQSAARGEAERAPSWPRRSQYLLRRLLSLKWRLWYLLGAAGEGDPRVLFLEERWGEFAQHLSLLGSYSSTRTKVRRTVAACLESAARRLPLPSPSRLAP